MTQPLYRPLHRPLTATLLAAACAGVLGLGGSILSGWRGGWLALPFLVAIAAAALGPDDVVKVNVYLTDMADFDAMNGAYRQMFEEPHPARTTVAVAGLPLGASVEIELVARRRQDSLS